MAFPRAPTGLQDSCVTPASVTPAQTGVQIPSGCTTTHAAFARRPTGFLCDPSPRLPFHEKVMSSKATWRLTVLELFAVLPSALFVGLCARCYLGSDEGGTASCEPVSA